ncbi:MAG: hypothetical protein GY855_00115 [candidate division Zixibacteria bacterium]|nr:hypothetical protein [candidate division Zixibacteria bacterium]
MRIARNLSVYLLWLLLLFLGCAKNIAPPGGPEDKTSPEVISVFPSAGATEVDLDSNIEIEFSEAINKTGITDGIFISPLFEDEPEYSWKGRKLIIKPSTPLRDNITYVIVVGTDVSDLRNNKLKYPFLFAFSTGDKIDKGQIKGYGYIDDRPVSGLGIWAYSFNDSILPDPVNVQPDYVTFTGEDGSFLLNHIAPGYYRLFAVQDANKDRLWDTDSEKYGTAPFDVSIGDDTLYDNNINLTAADFDTLPPIISYCNMNPGGIIEISFESELDFESAYDSSNYMFKAESAKSPIELYSIYTIPPNKSSVFLRCKIITEEAACTLLTTGIKSSNGVEIDTAGNSCLVVTRTKEDNEAPQILATYPSKGMQYYPVDSAIIITFSEPMNTGEVQGGFLINDTLDQRVNGDFYWENDIILRFKPDSLQGRMPYTLKLRPEKILDYSNNPIDDTLWSLKFSTMPVDTGGTAIGEIQSNSEGFTGLTFIPVSKGKTLTYYLPNPGKFSITGIPGGKYLVFAFLDINEDGKLFTGSYNPFRHSEIRAFYKDTIDVRPRWETDGIIINLQ